MAKYKLLKDSVNAAAGTIFTQLDATVDYMYEYQTINKTFDRMRAAFVENNPEWFAEEVNDRVEVQGIYRTIALDANYNFTLSKEIPEDKLPLIKEAIEKKINGVLFTTSDFVDVYEGDKFYYSKWSATKKALSEVIAKKGEHPFQTGIYFSKKENAELFISSFEDKTVKTISNPPPPLREEIKTFTLQELEEAIIKIGNIYKRNHDTIKHNRSIG